jgi:Cu/Ag efflux pump CusA
VPGLAIRLRPAALTATGLAADDVLREIETATRGTRVGQTFEGNRATDVVVLLDPEARARPEDLRKLPLRAPAGPMVTLDQVADIGRSSGRYMISHQGTRRVQTVTANASGRDVPAFARDLEQGLARQGVLPPGTYAELAGTAAAQRQAERELLLHSLLAGAVIFLLLWLAFTELNRLLLVLANLPFSLVGGIVAVALGGGVLSLGSLVGFVTLFGIATRNAVMLISHYEFLVTEEHEAWGAATALRGASERLGPILMTATVTGLALLPLAIGSGDPGREIEGPMAIVILGGLVTSTVLSLFVLPTLALRYGRFQRRKDSALRETGPAAGAG